MNKDIVISSNNSYDQKTDRIERFQSLQAGQYWRASVDIAEDCILAGMVLLIKSIRWVDEKPHTLILRAHPSVYNRSQKVQWTDENGHQYTSFKSFKEHRFLLDEFLAKFVFEPEAQKVRNAEVQKAQDQVQAIQAELMNVQSNPDAMAMIVHEKLLAQSQEVESSPTPGSLVPTGEAFKRDQEATSLATGAISGALTPAVTADQIDEMKAAATRQHEIATIKSNWIQGKTTEIAEAIMAITPYYEEQAAAALAATEDVREYAAKLTVGIQTLDLYVGRGVDVETIREGESAPFESPLTFVQNKLFMDEELAVWADIKADFDFEDEGAFFDALKANPEFMSQIFPTDRCIVGMATTRRKIDYGDAYANMVRNDMNKAVFLLVRDGQNLYRVFSPVESHQGALRLFPSQNESEGRFQGWDGARVNFEDVAYTDRLAAHEVASLHYKRLLILVCGLDHRLKLFGDFYPGQADMSFVSLKFQQDHCRFIHDDDQHTMLPGEDRASLKEWMDMQNANLRSGSRVLCLWSAIMDPTTAPGACSESNRDTYRTDYWPENKSDIKIAYKSAQSICVDVSVSGDTYNYEKRTFNCKVNLSKYQYGHWRYDDFAYLCLDAVSPENLRWYIHNRKTRMNRVMYIRLFKAALAFVEADHAQEAETRNKMANALIEGQVCPASKVDSVVNEAVIAWRAANRGAQLPGAGDEISQKDWKSLLNQMYLICGHGQDKAQQVQQLLEVEGLTPLRLVSHGSSGLAVYATAPSDERDDRLWPHEWVIRIALTQKKSGLGLGTRRHVRLDGVMAAEAILHEWEDCAKWGAEDLRSSFSSLEQKRAIFARTENAVQTMSEFNVDKLSEEKFAEHLNCWIKWRNKANEKGKFVSQPALFIPFGVYSNKQGNSLRYIGVGTAHPHALLYKLAPSDAHAQLVEREYIKLYKNKESAQFRFDRSIARHTPWELTLITMPSGKAALPLYVDESLGTPYQCYSPPNSVSPLLSVSFDGWLSKIEKENCRVWLNPDVLDPAGAPALDSMLGIELPSDYQPVMMVDIRIYDDAKSPRRWYICPEGTTIKDLMGKETGLGYSQNVYPNMASARQAIMEADVEGKSKPVLLQPANEGEKLPYIECYGLAEV